MKTAYTSSPARTVIRIRRAGWIRLAVAAVVVAVAAGADL